MDKIQGGGSFSVCPDTGVVTRDPESTVPEGADQAQPPADPAAPAATSPKKPAKVKE